MPSVKRQAAEVIAREHHLSIQRACRIVGLSRTAFYRVPKSSAERDGAVISVLNGMVAKRPRWGFWKCFDRMRIEGRLRGSSEAEIPPRICQSGPYRT